MKSSDEWHANPALPGNHPLRTLFVRIGHAFISPFALLVVSLWVLFIAVDIFSVLQMYLAFTYAFVFALGCTLAVSLFLSLIHKPLRSAWERWELSLLFAAQALILVIIRLVFGIKFFH